MTKRLGKFTPTDGELLLAISVLRGETLQLHRVADFLEQSMHARQDLAAARKLNLKLSAYRKRNPRTKRRKL
jgi:hypothetical protein